ncbi:MAG: carboxypeptidase-like regulatory domain-containing protein, partial [Actinocatenispora sp.]
PTAADPATVPIPGRENGRSGLADPVAVPAWAGHASFDAPVPGATWGGELAARRPQPPTDDTASIGIPVRGYLRDPNGDPIPGASLTLVDLSGGQADRGQSGLDGWYHLAAPTSAQYTLVIRATGHSPLASIVTAMREPVELDLILAGIATLAGTIRETSTRRPVAGATVTLLDAAGAVLTAAATDQHGRYRFTHLAAADYTVAVTADGHGPSALPFSVPDSGIRDADVDLSGASCVTGIARAARDQRPLADTRITLYDERGEPSAEAATGMDGRYVFDDLAPGQYTLVASGFPAVASSIRLAGGIRHELDVTLSYPEVSASEHTPGEFLDTTG